jgi:hypothetical protein
VVILHGVGINQHERIEFFTSGNISTINPVTVEDDISYVDSLGKQTRNKKRSMVEKTVKKNDLIGEKSNLHTIEVKHTGLEGEDRYLIALSNIWDLLSLIKRQKAIMMIEDYQALCAPLAALQTPSAGHISSITPTSATLSSRRPNYSTAMEPSTSLPLEVVVSILE